MIKNLILGVLAVLALPVLAVATTTEPTPPTFPEQAVQAINQMIADAGAVLFPGIVAILGVVAALIGLFFVIKLVRRYISGAKG